MGILGALDSTIFYRIRNDQYLYLYDYSLSQVLYAYKESFFGFKDAIIFNQNSTNRNNGAANNQATNTQQNTITQATATSSSNGSATASSTVSTSSASIAPTAPTTTTVS